MRALPWGRFLLPLGVPQLLVVLCLGLRTPEIFPSMLARLRAFSVFPRIRVWHMVQAISTAFRRAWRPAHRGQEKQNLVSCDSSMSLLCLTAGPLCSERPKKPGLVKGQLWAWGLKKSIYLPDFRLGTTLFPCPVTVLRKFRGN